MYETLLFLQNVENPKIYQDFEIQEPEKKKTCVCHQDKEILKFKFTMKISSLIKIRSIF